ncbi:MAG TPA: bacillithiol biosynthesis cysteine-adding enzyme BshC [Acidobacteriota bacterium]|nr:bacillithiol biosynthesis cysteine-adding enzyme BshC [Acidobacteriota bacterium]
MNDRATVAELPFSRIPSQSSLFLNYLDLNPAAVSFYQHAPTFQALVALARAGLGHNVVPRPEINSILSRQNERFGGDARCRQHIEELSRPDCFAVVTGQQAGLFTGPLYTIYKAFTAIQIAEDLRARNIMAVPVFWLDADDHDLAEVTRCTVVERDSSIQVIDYRKLLFGDVRESTHPVGSIEFPQSIREATEDYLSRLPGSEWKEQIRSLLEAAYRPGSSFADAFGSLMAGLFTGHGLILLDPQDADAKRLVSSVFQRVLSEGEDLRGLLTRRTRELETAGFQPQASVPDNSTLLFLLEQGERRALARDGTDFVLKGTSLQFSLNQLLGKISESPHLFSPNVLLRPLVQDTLLPTLCYVGGPGEIAYLAQAEPLYRRFDRPMPVVWPRVSLTLLEAELAELMVRCGLSLEDCFRGKEHVLEIMLSASGSASASGILAALPKELEGEFEGLRPIVTATDPSLGPAMDTAKRKIFHHLDGLRAKAVQSEARKNVDLLKRGELLVNTCYPNRNLQERELGICHFLSRGGPEVMKAIYSFMKLDSFAHRVMALA